MRLLIIFGAAFLLICYLLARNYPHRYDGFWGEERTRGVPKEQ